MKWNITFHFRAIAILTHIVESSMPFTAIVKARSELMATGMWSDILDQTLTSVSIALVE